MFAVSLNSLFAVMLCVCWRWLRVNNCVAFDCVISCVFGVGCCVAWLMFCHSAMSVKLVWCWLCIFVVLFVAVFVVVCSSVFVGLGCCLICWFCFCTRVFCGVLLAVVLCCCCVCCYVCFI